MGIIQAENIVGGDVAEQKKKSGVCHSSIIQLTYACSMRDLRAVRIVMKKPRIKEP